MTKKLLIPLLFFAIFQTAFAYETINAGVLSVTWYSSVNIFENQNLEIFAGIENHSTSSISFKGSFFVDNVDIYKVEGISNPDSIIEVSAPWKTTFGNHSVQFKITSASVNIDSLIAKDSGKNNFFVAKDLSISGIADAAKTAVAEKTDSILKKVDDSINNFTEKIADDILGFKTSSSTGQTVGTSTKNKTPSIISNILNNKAVASVWDTILNFFSYILRSWKITLIVIIVIVLLLKFML